MSRFLLPRLSSLTAYVPGEQPRGEKLVKLNTNESPFPPSPKVLEALCRAETERLHLYPDPNATALEEAIAARFGVSGNQVLAGNGSDELLAFCFQAFCGGVCFPDITYGLYAVLAKLYGSDARVIPLSDDFHIMPEDYYAAGRTILFANPNAPTGLYLTPGQVERILRNNPDSLVIVDEAYIDFGGESAAPLLSRCDNLLIVQTFSKSYSLAGARIGFALGCESLIDDLRRVKFSFNPYSVNRLSILAGAAAMADEPYFTACTLAVTRTRSIVAAELRARGFEVTDSMGNFLFVRPPFQSGRQFAEGLRARGVLVRHFAKPRIDGFVRVTIGMPEQMRALLDATDQIMEETE
ncbi:MAG: histidinol-phosphate transaminase [Clostridia bacterium]|nr:histidinol-phosphate transaminase [Clostridia bacterium]